MFLIANLPSTQFNLKTFLKTIMSSDQEMLKIIKGNSGASKALGQSRNSVLDETNGKSETSSEVTNTAKKLKIKIKAKTIRESAKSSSNTSSEVIDKTKKSATIEKAKKPSSADSEKGKKGRKEVASPVRKSKRQQGGVDYEEEPEEKTPKKTKAPSHTAESPKFLRMDEMRVALKDRMADDFEDFAVKPGQRAFLIHKKCLETVVVKQVKGAQTMIKQESGSSTLWVKRNQVLGDFDGEIRKGRVGLFKRSNHLPTLVTIGEIDGDECFVQNFHDGDEASGCKVFKNQVTMASPSTLREFRNKLKTSKKDAKEKVGKKKGRDFDVETFLKLQAERDEARNTANNLMIEKQCALFQSLAKTQSEQISTLLKAMSSSRNASADTSANEKDESKNKARKGSDENDG